MEEGSPDLLSIGAQGQLINYEISYITTEIMKAAEQHKKGLPYKASSASSSATASSDASTVGSKAVIRPIKQHLSGFRGFYRVDLVDSKPMSLDEFKRAALAAGSAPTCPSTGDVPRTDSV